MLAENNNTFEMIIRTSPQLFDMREYFKRICQGNKNIKKLMYNKNLGRGGCREMFGNHINCENAFKYIDVCVV